MKLRLVHTRLSCNSWHPKPEDCGLGCKVWTPTSWLAEQADYLRTFLRIRHTPQPATEAEIAALPLIRKRRERVIRKLRARRMKRYEKKWGRDRRQLRRA